MASLVGIEDLIAALEESNRIKEDANRIELLGVYLKRYPSHDLDYAWKVLFGDTSMPK